MFGWIKHLLSRTQPTNRQQAEAFRDYCLLNLNRPPLGWVEMDNGDWVPYLDSGGQHKKGGA